MTTGPGPDPDLVMDGVLAFALIAAAAPVPDPAAQAPA
jgi:hypothetical protein